jgi:NMD protein affecting ribosome stability and mRNA decay
MELKCIKCGAKAEYIVVVGSGGSLCEKCFKEFTEGLSASIEKLLLLKEFSESMKQSARE